MNVSNFDKAIQDLEEKKTSKDAALAELSDVYIAILQEMKYRKELLQYQATVDKLSGEGVCANIDTLDKALEANDNVYNAILENNNKIEDYAKNNEKENEEIGLEKYLEDEDEVFINYYELKDYILSMQENCINFGEGYVNEE